MKKTKPLKPSKAKEKKPLHDDEKNYSFVKMEEYLKLYYDFKYNQVTNEIEFKRHDEPEYKSLDDIELNSLYITYKKENIKFGQKDFERLLYSTFTPRYNPFADYFTELPAWDGVDHIKTLCSFVSIIGGAVQADRFYLHTKKMLLRTMACAIDDKFFNKQIFLLYGDAQNQAKTSFLRHLVPKKLEKYTTEHFNPAGEKDNAIAMCENLIINIDELGNLLKFELNKLKSIISLLTIKIRLPFGKRAVSIPRRASFVASTNIRDFLTDVTGNVRWVCFDVEKINFDYKNFDMDKVWAQVKHLYAEGAEMQISKEEMQENEENNSKYMQQTPEMEMINKYLIQGEKDKDEFMTSTDIVNHLSILASSAIRLTPVSIGKAMRHFKFLPDEKFMDEHKQPRKGYWIKCGCSTCEIKRKEKKEEIENAEAYAAALSKKPTEEIQGEI